MQRSPALPTPVHFFILHPSLLITAHQLSLVGRVNRLRQASITPQRLLHGSDLAGVVCDEAILDQLLVGELEG